MDNSPKLTVAVCTHNPREALLSRTLDGLKRQALPLPDWELLVIDNNSSQPVSQQHSLSWHPSGKWIREDRLGLVYARLTALKNALSDVIVFVDDDNILRDDYLENVLELFAMHPDLGTFGAGQIQPEFEAMPPKWLLEFEGHLALRNFDQPYITDSMRGYRPCGAGLCVRMEIARLYISKCSQHPNPYEIFDRRGNKLLSCGDDLFSLFAIDLGLKCGMFPELRILHLIPKERIEYEYFQQLVYYMAYSHAILSKHFKLPSTNPQPIPSLKVIAMMLLQGRSSDALYQVRLFLHYLQKPKIAKNLYHSRYHGWEAGLEDDSAN